MEEREAKSRRVWTVALCAAVLGLTVPVGAYGAATTVGNLSDRSRTGVDGDARILANKLGTSVCDVRTAGVAAAGCVKVSAGRLLTLDREPPEPFAAECRVAFAELTASGECRIAVPAQYVVESVTASGFHRDGDDMFGCRVLVPQNPVDRHPVEVPLEWVGSDDLTAFFSGHLSVRLHGVAPTSDEGLVASCRRESGGSGGRVDVAISGYSY